MIKCFCVFFCFLGQIPFQLVNSCDSKVWETYLQTMSSSDEVSRVQQYYYTCCYTFSHLYYLLPASHTHTITHVHTLTYTHSLTHTQSLMYTHTRHTHTHSALLHLSLSRVCLHPRRVSMASECTSRRPSGRGWPNGRRCASKTWRGTTWPCWP